MKEDQQHSLNVNCWEKRKLVTFIDILRNKQNLQAYWIIEEKFKKTWSKKKQKLYELEIAQSVKVLMVRSIKTNSFVSSKIQFMFVCRSVQTEMCTEKKVHASCCCFPISFTEESRDENYKLVTQQTNSRKSNISVCRHLKSANKATHLAASTSHVYAGLFDWSKYRLEIHSLLQT